MKVTKRLVQTCLAVLAAAVVLAGLLGAPALSIAIVFFWIAAVLAIAFPVVYYFGSPWRTTLVGKAMMTKSTSIAVLFIISILIRIVPDFPGRDWLILFAYMFLAVALFFQDAILIGQQSWFRRRYSHNRDNAGQR